jgi:hypothetical protein
VRTGASSITQGTLEKTLESTCPRHGITARRRCDSAAATTPRQHQGAEAFSLMGSESQEGYRRLSLSWAGQHVPPMRVRHCLLASSLMLVEEARAPPHALPAPRPRRASSRRRRLQAPRPRRAVLEARDLEEVLEAAGGAVLEARDAALIDIEARSACIDAHVDARSSMCRSAVLV